MPAREVASYVRRRKRIDPAQFAHARSHVQVPKHKFKFRFASLCLGPSSLPGFLLVCMCNNAGVFTSGRGASQDTCAERAAMCVLDKSKG